MHTYILGAAVVDEVELDVAASAKKLPLTLRLSVCMILVLLHCQAESKWMSE